MSQRNPKEFVHNIAYSVQLPYIAGLSLYPAQCDSDLKSNFVGWVNSLTFIYFMIWLFERNKFLAGDRVPSSSWREREFLAGDRVPSWRQGS